MKDNHLSDGLLASKHIISSDEDQSAVQDLTIGLSSNLELYIVIDHSDYKNRRYNCSTAAVVDCDNTLQLAKRHKVAIHELPEFISNYIYEWMEENEVDEYTGGRSDVVACFKEITECLLDERCKFNIQRTYGKDGYSCC